MKHHTFASLLTCFVFGLCAPLLSRCGGDASFGTETGNPPRLEQKKLFLLPSVRGVELIGDAGAVSAGALVSITNLSTGARAETSALENGSLDLFVAGSTEDEYEVTVTNEQGTTSVRLSPASEGAVNPLGELSCTAIDRVFSHRVDAVLASTDRSCSIDSDCRQWFFPTCNVGECETSYVSATALTGLDETVERETGELCRERSRCGGSLLPCVGTFEIPDCQNGVCQYLDLNVEPSGCDDRVAEAGSRLREELTHADRSCTRDEDCSLINPHLSCVADCGNFAAVAESAVLVVEQHIQDVELTFCDSLVCPAPSPLPCDPALEPTTSCIAGQCALVRGEP